MRLYLPNPEPSREESAPAVSTRFLIAWFAAIILFPALLVAFLNWAVPLDGLDLLLEAVR